MKKMIILLILIGSGCVSYKPIQELKPREVNYEKGQELKKIDLGKLEAGDKVRITKSDGRQILVNFEKFENDTLKTILFKDPSSGEVIKEKAIPYHLAFSDVDEIESAKVIWIPFAAIGAGIGVAVLTASAINTTEEFTEDFFCLFFCWF